MIQLSYKQQIAFSSLSIIAGNALYALTVVLFLVPSGLITGGATGIAPGVNRVLGLPVSGVLFAINISMLVLGWVVLGSRFALTTIASTILSPLFLALWERVFTGFVLTDDLVLNTIFAGLGVGISLGITIRAGASTGGMDIPPIILHKLFGLSIPVMISVGDILLLLVQAFYSSTEQVLYGILVVMLTSIVIDKVLIMGQKQTQVMVISPEYERINQAIHQKIDRGSTLIHATSGLEKQEQKVVLSVISNRQLGDLNELILQIDPQAFVIANEVNEVKGRGFTLSKLSK